MSDPIAELVLQAAKLVRRLRRDANVPASYRVLAVLDDIGPVGISQLAVADGTSQPTMSAQVAALVTSGYAGTTGYTTGRAAVREVFAYWPALIAKSAVQAKVEVM